MKKAPTAKSPCGTQQARPVEDNIDLQYKQGPLGRAWSGTSKRVRSQNPICQRILNVGLYKNEQCHSPAVLVHHHHSPRNRPDLFLKVYDENGKSNLIALCAGCHIDSEGTDGMDGVLWVEGIDFVRTEYAPFSVS